MLEIYTDGACKGNPGPGGWGFICFLDDKIVFQNSGYNESTTNNQMELRAVIEALLECNRRFPDKRMILFTDSMYVKCGITQWIPRWKQNNWMTQSKNPVKNRALWEELDSLFDTHRCTLQWVKAHNGNVRNELADRLANSFMNSQNDP